MLAGVMISCNKHDGVPTDAADINIRAQALGFATSAEYEEYVTQECAAGNHANCDTSVYGRHYACAHVEHAGACKNGTLHSGTAHGTHNEDGHSGCGQDNGGHHGGR